MNRDFLIYFAGFFDGEGCIGLYRYPPKKGFPNHSLRLMISATNTKREVLDEAKAYFGGGIVIRNKQEINIKWKKCYHWRVTGKQAEAFLREIYPYLKIKKPQAEVALKYRDTVRDIYHHETIGKPMNENIIGQRSDFYEQMKKLNYRGIPIVN